MKILLILAFVFITPFSLKAQDPTLGKSKEQIRAMIQPSSGIKLSQGDNCDTLSMEGGLKIFMYYKNNVCFTSKSVMPLKYINMVVDKMTHDSYKKVKENVWISASGKVRVEITINKDTGQFISETSQVDEK